MGRYDINCFERGYSIISWGKYMATPMGSQPMEIRQQRTRNEAA
jgi:hypothetical protein